MTTSKIIEETLEHMGIYHKYWSKKDKREALSYALQKQREEIIGKVLDIIDIWDNEMLFTEELIEKIKSLKEGK